MIVLFFGVIILVWVIAIIYLVIRQERLDLEEEEQEAELFRELIRKKFDTKGERKNGS